jgi:hypothetical protein
MGYRLRNKELEMNSRATEIRAQIEKAAGIIENTINGHAVFFTVKEMYDRTHSWKSTPSGRFQINVGIYGSMRDKIFRTKKKDGSFDLAGVVEALHDQAYARKREKEIADNQKSNESLVQEVLSTYKGKKYVSQYGGSGTYCKPSVTPGKVELQVNFGNIDPETAKKILAMVQALEA